MIRDVGRVLDMPYAQVDAIAKMVPNELNITIDKALTMSAELRKACEEDPGISHLIDMAKRLEGLPRHTSMHAAGVVISKKLWMNMCLCPGRRTAPSPPSLP